MPAEAVAAALLAGLALCLSLSWAAGRAFGELAALLSKGGEQ